MLTLHRAALIRAYRTLAQGLGGSALSVALVAIFTDGQAAVPAIVAALGTTVIAAFVSFWQGVAGGLPEAELGEVQWFEVDRPGRHVLDEPHERWHEGDSEAEADRQAAANDHNVDPYVD